MNISEKLANPAPLGLMGFGMTTVLLNLHNVGIFELGSMILAMGIFYGGLAQVIAGILEFKKGNTFGTTAFTSYGMFWISLVALRILPKLGLGQAPETIAMVAYLGIWGLFTLGMFLITLKGNNKQLQLIFGTLALLFILLALGDYTGSAVIKTIAGYEGIFCGITAIGSALCQVKESVVSHN
ncbi:acetate uptake transporter [Methanococcus voltae]|uniref:GPR1/FUN34/yaaH family protein n=1 Tax=Methanococcus voltae (strain ATCC BAA-1334 / A3) TaxID=456320 RepID=D7DTD4_METV3|nr:GPR1/FUN34/YaaH family transporter [Methanococcus voltae]MCS3901245.1 succinate-acetate transporter protein [Methanococcus voltae]